MHLDFKATGLRVLKGSNGDLLIADAGWKTGVALSHTIRWQKLEEAMKDDREAAIIIRQLYNFLCKHASEAELQKAKAEQEVSEEKSR